MVTSLADIFGGLDGPFSGVTDVMLLPPKEGTCPACAVAHEDGLPHDATSLYYQTRFVMLRGRAGTWADAAAHCTAEIRAAWRSVMEKKGYPWTEPQDGSDPIADPPGETIRQPVGDPRNPGPVTLRVE